ncbi:type II toxin-antitoxin system RelE/ParE family toxin [Bowmanella dokdonensis]|uniref:Toxin n=1 Tax=Bowmanella dokdonensis TaxID=751969 RepID=A0A939DN08_9ALTE|nr:type II toxin-antitoxin system RelE/ParE family toxin [Bowmanella dokdonensis]MBN7825783.1 type II toxin-antitoxin system RelE/ParE family toxin [Bowmanella dokdonensis]
MSSYRLSSKAAEDLASIFQYTARHFGSIQAESYLLSLQACFEQLASNPKLAHRADEIRAGYRRYVHAKHNIFFIVRSQDIFIVRVLHQQMKYQLHISG